MTIVDVREMRAALKSDRVSRPTVLQRTLRHTTRALRLQRLADERAAHVRRERELWGD